MRFALHTMLKTLTQAFWLGLFVAAISPTRAQRLPVDGFCPIPDIPQYTMWLRGGGGQFDYEKRLIDMLLSKTSADYGPYALIPYKRELNFERERLESLNAQNYHIHIAPDYPDDQHLRRDFVRLEQPVAQGLFGYRRLIVRRSDLDKFSRIHDQKHLQQLIAGQGLGWPDTQILRNNGFKVIESVNLSSLLGMLSKHRFDFIPMAAHEIEATMTAMADQFPDLVPEPNILIYYPVALYIFARQQDERLIERLQSGLKQSKHDGSFHHLFNSQFGRLIGSLQQPNIRVFNLQNQKISAAGVQNAPVLIVLPASARSP